MSISIKLSRYVFKKLLWYFCLDLTATQIALLTGLNRNTINRYVNIFRRLIFSFQVTELKRFKGDIELDESYFGPRRLKGTAITKRGRGTHKQPVFGIYERHGRVYTEIIPNCHSRTLHAIITGKVALASTIYSDSWRGYDGLVDMGYNKHFRIKHHRNEFARKKGVHINGIESFWSFTKRRLTKFNGTKKNFLLHLKECEWRWDKKPQQLQQEMNRLLKDVKVRYY
jgi:transposase-like protein